MLQKSNRHHIIELPESPSTQPTQVKDWSDSRTPPLFLPLQEKLYCDVENQRRAVVTLASISEQKTRQAEKPSRPFPLSKNWTDLKTFFISVAQMYATMICTGLSKTERGESGSLFEAQSKALELNTNVTPRLSYGCFVIGRICPWSAVISPGFAIPLLVGGHVLIIFICPRNS